MVDVLTDFRDERFTPQWVKDERQRKQQAYIASLRRQIIACDLGRNVDRSIITGLDCTPESVIVTNIESFTRTDYNQLCDRLLQIKSVLPNALLIYDGTGVGTAVTDLMLARGLKPHLSVVITAGIHTSYRTDMTGTPVMSVPKPDLVAHLIKVLNEGRLIINSNAAGAALLQQELTMFQAVVRSTGHIAYSAPPNAHDDCVMSLAVGLAGYSRVARQLQQPAARMRRLYG